MNELKNKAAAISELLDNVQLQLNLLNTNNFDDNFQFILETMMVIQRLRKDLEEKYGVENIIKYSPELLLKAKQIEKSYDNIIENFRAEMNYLAKEISRLNGKKKIANYIR
ncbi:MAG: hypothetical protein HYS25_08375 [Ignavibacteriales bacterium]|nr:hypothetical protein [Ignavibacteriales bacterium]